MEQVLGGAGRQITKFIFNFGGLVIQLQCSESQKRSAKSQKKYFWTEKSLQKYIQRQNHI
jgi:hypothetical protein